MSVEFARQYRKVRKAVPLDRRRKVWGSMIYACDACGFERRVYLGVGCEGPPAMKEQGLFLPVPLKAGMCPRCAGAILTHVRWDEDETFGEEMDPPDGAAVFWVPGKATASRFAEGGYGGAELIETG